MEQSDPSSEHQTLVRPIANESAALLTDPQKMGSRPAAFDMRLSHLLAAISAARRQATDLPSPNRLNVGTVSLQVVVA
jgi:hypothetical protein